MPCRCVSGFLQASGRKCQWTCSHCAEQCREAKAPAWASESLIGDRCRPLGVSWALQDTFLDEWRPWQSNPMLHWVAFRLWLSWADASSEKAETPLSPLAAERSTWSLRRAWSSQEWRRSRTAQRDTSTASANEWSCTDPHLSYVDNISKYVCLQVRKGASVVIIKLSFEGF